MSDRPNILLILTDQQRSDSLACYGNAFVHSPNIDRLASEGVRFRDGFTPFPLCTPARASLWTGTYPHLHDIMDCVYGIEDAFERSPAPATVFDRLSEAGYLVGYFGKWHLGERRPSGIDHWDATNSEEGHWVDGHLYIPEAQTRRMIDFLRDLRGERRPFFLVQSYRPPHEPYTAPERDMRLYRGKGIFRPGYYASVTALDRCVGEILKALEGTGARDDTLVLYTSDHGEHFNYRARNNKTTGHDDSIRIPFIAAWPGRLLSGMSVRGAVGLQDVTPTLLDFAGCAIPGYLHGRSLRHLMLEAGGQGAERYYVQNTEDFRSFETWDRLMSAGGYAANSRSYRSPDREWDRQRALWTPGSKLILSEHGNHALFDLERDPEEELNLFGAPRTDFFLQYTHFQDQREKTVLLGQMLREEAQRVGDEWGAALASEVLDTL